MDSEKALTKHQFSLEAAILEWLRQKQTRTSSKKTRIAYEDTMQSFRMTLQRGGLDLLSNPLDIARVATIWAALRSPGMSDPSEVAPATYNQRLAIISSFYTFLQEIYQLDYVNPIESIKKRPVQAYGTAMPLEVDEVADRLEGIDRSTPQGKRDYALLAVALSTGRRASELVSLRWRHVQFSGKKIILHFEECKGGKKMKDQLDANVASVLLDYLQSVYEPGLSNLTPDSPVWISFSRQNKGKAITTHTLNDICETYLGTTKIHALRHTFAVEMEKAGAPLSEIQARLGHENITTTSIYMKSVRSAENPYAGRLSARFGIRKD
ncbi:MAG TPA: tyrosine-type recombinase/integrase [Ktedonobacteraceae bacterium]|nr:tyrosine-type recombinase/integrase [Ktedonobacteraceae bacterium]